jgi:hypothetical protein
MLFTDASSSTEMQICLNEEASHYNRQFRKYPMLWILLFLYVATGVALVYLVLQCNISFSCTFAQQDAMLWLGMMILLSLVPCIIAPCLLRFTLNCFFERPKLAPVKKMSPLHQALPKPPSTPPPKHAMKSFRETMAV